MKYAKFVSRYTLNFFKNPLHINGRDIFTNNPTNFGFKPVVYPDRPEQDGYQAVLDGFEETDTEIRALWALEPVSDDMDPEQIVEEIKKIL